MDNEKSKNNVKGNRRERANKGGRPVKGITEKLKYRITVKMATEDYYLLKSKAKSAGVSASEFIRKLCGMANNLNQLARKANAEGYTSAFVTCRTLMIEIDNLVNRIHL